MDAVNVRASGSEKEGKHATRWQAEGDRLHPAFR